MDGFRQYLAEAEFDRIDKTKVGFFQRQRFVERFAGDPDVFGSFTAIPKLGINPKTRYDTPVGIYAYPINYVAKLWRPDSGTWKVPFAGDQPYLHIFRNIRPDDQLHFRPGDNRKLTQLEDDRNKVDNVVRHIADTYLLADLHGKSDAEVEQEALDLVKQAPKGAQEYLDSLVRHVPKAFRHNLDSLVGDVLKDTASDMDKGNIFPYEDQVRRIFDQYYAHRPDLDQVYNDWKQKTVLGQGQRIHCDNGFVWNATRHLAKSNSKWTGLLRALGIRSVQDHGTGTIHDNEPTQAVFFYAGDLKILQVVDNQIQGRKAMDVLSAKQYGTTNNLNYMVMRRDFKGIKEKLVQFVAPVTANALGGLPLNHLDSFLTWIASASYALRNNNELDPNTSQLVSNMANAIMGRFPPRPGMPASNAQKISQTILRITR